MPRVAPPLRDRSEVLKKALALSGPDRVIAVERLVEEAGPKEGWLSSILGRVQLDEGNFDEAAGALRRGLRAVPDDWLARAWYAETLACLGRPADALAQAARARAAASGDDVFEALAHEGKLLLWFGRYEDALDRLDKAARKRFDSCGWSVGASLLLEGPREALARLDALRGPVPVAFDQEAAVWRGEALRRIGRRDEALAELKGDLVTFKRLNRALLLAETGDRAGMIADFLSLPSHFVERLRRKARLPADRALDDAEIRGMLEKALVLARGFRREEHEHSVWLPR